MERKADSDGLFCKVSSKGNGFIALTRHNFHPNQMWHQTRAFDNVVRKFPSVFGDKNRRRRLLIQSENANSNIKPCELDGHFLLIHIPTATFVCRQIRNIKYAIFWSSSRQNAVSTSQ